MNSDCRDCRAGLDHCHGTVIVHVRCRAECTENDCDDPGRISHAMRIDCEVVGCTCGQVTALAV
jgi:hypothetical protein